jgi:20S proteasome subunit beta 6
VGRKNRNDAKTPLTAEEAVAIVKHVFVVATERDIYTGDSVEIKLITRDGIKFETFKLKTD